MEIKQLGGPIKDFDQGGYDGVEFIPKKVTVNKIALNNKILVNSVVEREKHELDLSIASGSQLLDYFVERFEQSHGYKYVVLRDRDVNIMDNFRDRYGLDAGPMIKILFDNHNGKLDATEGIISPTAFAKGSKWIQDMLYCELQEEKKKTVLDNSSEGLMSADDFIRAFKMAK
jgi:hypothetical protein